MRLWKRPLLRSLIGRSSVTVCVVLYTCTWLCDLLWYLCKLGRLLLNLIIIGSILQQCAVCVCVFVVLCGCCTCVNVYSFWFALVSHFHF